MLPGTGFEVGDVFSAGLIVSPPIPAEVEVRLLVAPDSDASRMVTRVVRGRANRFGHPSPAVLRRYEAIGAEVFRTDQDGQIDLVTNGHYIEVSTFTGRRWRLR